MFKNERPCIMGILNVTPDSFSDGGKYTGLSAALAQAEQMIFEGADIIDVGGESTRPGSTAVSASEQINRVIPAIKAIRKQHTQVLISIDTRLSEVAEAALAEGANIINDVSAGQTDPNLLKLAANHQQVSIILMHSQGTPETMQDKPFYHDALSEVKSNLQKSVRTALEAGIKPEQIILDPGIGFGKRKQDNLALIAGLDSLVAIGYPLLLGTSRKRFMGNILAVNEHSELVTATAVTTALGVMAGVKCFRVHDVLANRQAADLAWAIYQAKNP